MLPRRTRARGFRRLRLARRLGHVAGAQRHQRGELQPLRLGGIGEELGHPAVAEQLSPRHVGADELTELRHHERCRRIDRRGGVEHHVGAFEVAGECQQLAQQHARVEIGRRLAQRRLRRRHRVVELAGVKQRRSRLVSAAHETPKRAASRSSTAEIGDELE